MNTALLCPWEAPQYLIFSSNVPNLLHYSHIPVVIAALILGFFVYFNSRSLASKILFALIIFFCGYVFLDSVIWGSNRSDIVILLWSMQILIEPLVFALGLYLSYVFITNNDVKFNIKALAVLLLAPFIILVPTKYDLSGVRTVTCDANEGPIALYYSYALEIFFALCIIFFSIKTYIKSQDVLEKKKIKFFGIGIVLFLAAFSWGNIVGSFTEDWKIAQYGLFGMPIFMGFLAYLIVKFKAFDIKLIGAQALVAALVVLTGSQFFFTPFENTTNIILISVTVLTAVVMGIYLVRSVKMEVQRKEELQTMSGKLSEANDQLRKLDNAKSEFISIASHQLRTPLTAIKGFVSLILEGSYGALQPRQQEVLNKIYLSNERLVNLVEDLLNVSRMESGRMEFKLDNWRLEIICKEVMDISILKAKEHNLYLEYTPPATPLPEVMIDGTKVREVVSNVVDNAIKYTPKGGVTLRLEKFEDSRYNERLRKGIKNNESDVAMSDQGGVIRITVSDTGIGIPETELPYLFAKFSRGKDISRLNTGGTGLGLYVGRSMIENNGGRIWAESDGEGKGSRFLIEIPIQQSQEILERWG